MALPQREWFRRWFFETAIEVRHRDEGLRLFRWFFEFGQSLFERSYHGLIDQFFLIQFTEQVFALNSSHVHQVSEHRRNEIGVENPVVGGSISQRLENCSKGKQRGFSEFSLIVRDDRECFGQV